MINQDLKCPVCKYGIDPTCGVHGTKAITAPNTPTPELERLEVTESYLRAYGSIENAIAVHKAIETITEQAAAIAKLTAERDALQRWKDIRAAEITDDQKRMAALEAERDAFEARLISCDANLTHTLKEYTEMTLERDRAERRGKELEAERDAARDAHTTSMGNLTKAHAAVHEWKERVAVLDAMLRELKAATGHDDGLIAIRHLVLRATQAEDYITAREAK